MLVFGIYMPRVGQRTTYLQQMELPLTERETKAYFKSFYYFLEHQLTATSPFNMSDFETEELKEIFFNQSVNQEQ